jgi:hypothetical protein
MLRKESAGGMTEDVVMGFGDALGRTRLLRKETADGGSGFIELGKVLRLQGREALGMERVGSKLAEGRITGHWTDSVATHCSGEDEMLRLKDVHGVAADTPTKVGKVLHPQRNNEGRDGGW